MVETIPNPTSNVRSVGFFQQDWPANVILATFFVLTLPLAVLAWHNNSHIALWMYVWLFGMTHFVLTFSIYLNRANLVHFASSRKNQVLFFVLPAGLFVGMYLLQVLQVREAFPLFAIGLGVVIRFFDFTHFSRQAFGVMQMFKGQSGRIFPKEWKKLENYYGFSMTLLLMVTFLGGGINPLLQAGGPFTLAEIPSLTNPIVPIFVLQYAEIVLLVVMGTFLGLLVQRYCRMERKPADSHFNKPLAYLILQTLSGMLAVFSSVLYLATLAIHYVEYHVLMIPRCFNIPLDQTSAVDRFFGRLRKSAVRFYAVVLFFAGLVTICLYLGARAMGMSDVYSNGPPSYLLIISLFDGLFVFHYLVESLIWRFSDPYFRKSLGGLYFAPVQRS